MRILLLGAFLWHAVDAGEGIGMEDAQLRPCIDTAPPLAEYEVVTPSSIVLGKLANEDVVDFTIDELHHRYLFASCHPQAVYAFGFDGRFHGAIQFKDFGTFRGIAYLYDGIIALLEDRAGGPCGSHRLKEGRHHSVVPKPERTMPPRLFFVDWENSRHQVFQYEMNMGSTIELDEWPVSASTSTDGVGSMLTVQGLQYDVHRDTFISMAYETARRPGHKVDAMWLQLAEIHHDGSFLFVDMSIPPSIHEFNGLHLEPATGAVLLLVNEATLLRFSSDGALEDTETLEALNGHGSVGLAIDSAFHLISYDAVGDSLWRFNSTSCHTDASGGSSALLTGGSIDPKPEPVPPNPFAGACECDEESGACDRQSNYDRCTVQPSAQACTEKGACIGCAPHQRLWFCRWVLPPDAMNRLASAHVPLPPSGDVSSLGDSRAALTDDGFASDGLSFEYEYAPAPAPAPASVFEQLGDTNAVSAGSGISSYPPSVVYGTPTETKTKTGSRSIAEPVKSSDASDAGSDVVTHRHKRGHPAADPAAVVTGRKGHSGHEGMNGGTNGGTNDGDAEDRHNAMPMEDAINAGRNTAAAGMRPPLDVPGSSDTGSSDTGSSDMQSAGLLLVVLVIVVLLISWRVDAPLVPLRRHWPR